MNDDEVDFGYLCPAPKIEAEPDPEVVEGLFEGLYAEIAAKHLPPPPPDDLACMPSILARSLSVPESDGWQYHPRTGRHSKITCWGVLFDLLRACPLLLERAQRGEVVFGINSARHSIDKELDLVIGTPTVWNVKSRLPGDLASHAREYNTRLCPEEQAALQALQNVREGAIHQVQLALEAKAAMTDHGGELPRLQDELDKFHQRMSAVREGTIDNVQIAFEAKAIMTDHSRELPTLSDQLDRFQKRIQTPTISVGFVMTNVAATFVSPGKNGYDSARQKLSLHKQPYDARRVADMARALPLRGTQSGFDVLGTLVVDCPNDGSRIKVVAPDWDPHPYGEMIRRMAQLYVERFS